MTVPATILPITGIGDCTGLRDDITDCKVI